MRHLEVLCPGALLSAVGALKLGVNGQGGSSGAICKSDLKSPKFDKLTTVLSGLSAQAGLDEAAHTSPAAAEVQEERG